MLMGNRFFAAMVVLLLVAIAVAYFICRSQSSPARPSPGAIPASGDVAQPPAVVPDGQT